MNKQVNKIRPFPGSRLNASKSEGILPMMIQLDYKGGVENILISCLCRASPSNQMIFY